MQPQIVEAIYLTNTNTHCKTPATPVHTDGPVFTKESCNNSPTEAARETKDTTYAKKSQSFNLLEQRENLASITLSRQIVWIKQIFSKVIKVENMQ